MNVIDVTASAYTVPTDQPEADGTLAWDSTTLVVVNVSDGDEKGLGWTYASAGAVNVIKDQLTSAVTGSGTAEIPRLAEQMARACRNLGRSGVAASAISAVDIALWDLRAPASSAWPSLTCSAGLATRYPCTAAADLPPMTTRPPPPNWRPGSMTGPSLGPRSRSVSHGAPIPTATSPESHWPAR